MQTVHVNRSTLVETAYETASDEAFYANEGIDGSAAGYYAGKRRANELGGKAIFNANEGHGTHYMYPSIIYEFEDGSLVEVSYGYAQSLTPERANEIIEFAREHRQY